MGQKREPFRAINHAFAENQQTSTFDMGRGRRARATARHTPCDYDILLWLHRIHGYHVHYRPQTALAAAQAMQRTWMETVKVRAHAYH